jgi:hypothetical protein
MLEDHCHKAVMHFCFWLEHTFSVRKTHRDSLKWKENKTGIIGIMVQREK